MIIGAFETVSLPDLKARDILAKIDTGAYSGALHCTDIHVVRRGITRKRVLKFIPLGDLERATETDKFIRTYVRSATGHRVKRYLIDTKLELHGKVYKVRIGLSDRSDMKRSLLLGRRFLRENGIVVDVRINQQYDDEGEMSQ